MASGQRSPLHTPELRLPSPHSASFGSLGNLGNFRESQDLEAYKTLDDLILQAEETFEMGPNFDSLEPGGQNRFDSLAPNRKEKLVTSMKLEGATPHVPFPSDLRRGTGGFLVEEASWLSPEASEGASEGEGGGGFWRSWWRGAGPTRLMPFCSRRPGSWHKHWRIVTW